MSTTTRKARVARAAAVAVIAGSAIGGVATSSQAAATMMLGYNQNSGFLGIEEWSGYPYGRGICMDGGAAEPDVNMIAFSATQVADASVGWMMNQYLYTGDQVTAAALAYNVKQIYDPVALGRIMNNLSNTYGSGAAAAVVDRANSMQAEAAAAKGPYVGHVSMTFDANQRQGMITNVGVTSASGGWYAGHWLRLTLNGPAVFYNNSNVLDVQSTSSAQAHGWRATGSGQVSVTLTSVYTNLPPINFIMDAPPWDASPNGSGSTVGYQRAGRGSDEYLSVNAYDPGGMAQVEYEPKVSTQTSQANVNAGTVLSDTVSVTGGPPNTEVTVTNTLWGPFDSAPAQSTTLPSADKNVGTATTKVTLDAKGAGTATSTGVTVPGRGYYVWTESLAAGADAAGVPWKAFQGDFGVATETSLSHGAIVGSTQTSRQTANGGMALSDTINIEKAFTGFKGTVTATLYGAMPAADFDTCEAITPAQWEAAITAGTVTKVGEVSSAITGDADGNVEVVTPEVATRKAGCHTWAESLKNDTTGQIETTTQPGEENESTMVDTPEITTVTSDKLINGGEILTDKVNISKAYVGFKGSIVASLYGPLVPAAGVTCEELDHNDWRAAIGRLGATKKIGSTAPVTFDGTVDGNVTITTPGVATKGLGCYTWSQELTNLTTGAVEVTTPFAAANESSLAISPSMRTQTSAEVTSPGTPIKDTIFVKNAFEGYKGRITAQLYGPMALPEGITTCEAIGTKAWAEAIAAGDVTKHGDAVTVDVFGKGEGAEQSVVTPEVVTGKKGCYTWGEQMLNLTTNLPDGSTKPGEVDENTDAVPPAMKTRTSRVKAAAGAALTDTIDITGAFKGYKGTITAQLYGPLKPVTGTTCEAMGTEAWTKALEAGEVAPHGEAVVIEVEGTEDGNVTVTTPEVETGGYGCYSWGEVLTNDVTGEDDDTTIPGEEDENTLIVEPEMITQSSKMVALPGAKVYDTIQVSGIHDEEATMEATFWGVAKPDLAKDCTSLTEEDWAKLIKDGTVKEMGAPEVIEVTGDGEYKTKEMEVKEIGCYTWSEKLTLHDVVEDETLPKDKQVNIVAETLPGVVEETTLVIKPEITTVAKANGSRVDAIMTDDITVKGLHNQPATITGQVFGPLLRNADGTCEGLDWSTAAKAADIAPIKITADGTFTSSEFKIPATGCYTYVEQLTIDSNKEEFANTKPGEVTETLYFQDRARGGGDGIAAGIPDAVFPAAGLGLIALGAGVYLVTRRRKGEQG